MIYTITLNPAIDHAVFMDSMHKNDIIIVRNSHKEPAGKGINVSRVLRVLSTDSTVCALLGGTNGTYIKDYLESERFSTIVTEVAGETRENIKLIPQDGSVIELNELGPICTDHDVDVLLQEVMNHIKKGDIIVISGSIPRGLSSNVYHRIIEQCNHHGILSILDTSLESLVFALDAKPFMIKPNIHELEAIVGHSLSSTDDIVKEARKLINRGIQEVIITMGSKGSIYVNDKTAIQIDPIIVQPINTVGAGDSFVAGYVKALSEGFDIIERITYATAVATTSVMQPTTVLTDCSLIEEFQNMVHFYPISNNQ